MAFISGKYGNKYVILRERLRKQRQYLGTGNIIVFFFVEQDKYIIISGEQGNKYSLPPHPTPPPPLSLAVHVEFLADMDGLISSRLVLGRFSRQWRGSLWQNFLPLFAGFSREEARIIADCLDILVRS